MKPGEVQVDDGHVRPQAVDLIQRGRTIGTLSNDLEMRVADEHSGQTITAQSVFVGKQDRDFSEEAIDTEILKKCGHILA